MVAIKEIRLQGLKPNEVIDATDTFNREASILSELRHPNLPRIYDSFTAPEHWYLVMDFIDGETLETYLECAGNLTKTSERLFVHRNTLIQRLERLQSLCDIDLQERGNWLTLQVAIKVYKLRTGTA